jgi:hypothetical protein
MGTSYAPNIVKDGLIFSVDAANPRSYPGSGTSCTDLIEKQTGTLQSSGMFENINSGVFNFDGNTNYIDLGNNVFFNTSDAFSFLAWVNLNSYTNTYPYIANIKTNETDGFAIFLSSTSNYQGLNIGSTDSSITKGRTTGDISGTFLNSWNHAVITYNGSGANTLSNYSIYVNGSSVTLTTTGAFLTITNANNLARLGNGSFYLDGNIGPVQIYNRALSATEVKQNYNALKGRFQ